MKFIIGGEGGLGWLERLTYRGAIGIFYSTTWEGVLTYVIVGLILLLAAIGLITVIKSLFSKKKRGGKDEYDNWLKTGKYK